MTFCSLNCKLCSSFVWELVRIFFTRLFARCGYHGVKSETSSARFMTTVSRSQNAASRLWWRVEVDVSTCATTVPVPPSSVLDNVQNQSTMCEVVSYLKQTIWLWVCLLNVSVMGALSCSLQYLLPLPHKYPLIQQRIKCDKSCLRFCLWK